MPRALPEQHAVLEFVLEDVSRQLCWPKGGGALHGQSWWWQMIVASYDRLKGEECELVPAIDGKGFDGHGYDFVRGERRRRKLNNKEISEIIEYARAFAIDHGVKLSEPKERQAA